MRRRAPRLVLPILLVSLALSPTPAGAEPRPFAVINELAVADWVVKTGKDYWVYTVAASDYSELVPAPPADGSVVLVARAKCVTTRRDGIALVTCALGGWLRPAPDGAFTMEPGLREAALDLRRGRYRHRATWTADGAPFGSPVVAVGGTSGSDVTAGGFVVQPAAVQARLFGRDLRRNVLAEAFMVGTILAGEYEVGGATFAITEDGRFRLERRYRIRSD